MLVVDVMVDEVEYPMAAILFFERETVLFREEDCRQKSSGCSNSCKQNERCACKPKVVSGGMSQTARLKLGEERGGFTTVKHGRGWVRFGTDGRRFCERSVGKTAHTTSVY
jgi:hypothetical protein